LRGLRDEAEAVEAEVRRARGRLSGKADRAQSLELAGRRKASEHRTHLVSLIRQLEQAHHEYTQLKRFVTRGVARGHDEYAAQRAALQGLLEQLDGHAELYAQRCAAARTLHGEMRHFTTAAAALEREHRAAAARQRALSAAVAALDASASHAEQLAAAAEQEAAGAEAQAAAVRAYTGSMALFAHHTHALTVWTRMRRRAPAAVQTALRHADAAVQADPPAAAAAAGRAAVHTRTVRFDDGRAASADAGESGARAGTSPAPARRRKAESAGAASQRRPVPPTNAEAAAPAPRVTSAPHPGRPSADVAALLAAAEAALAAETGFVDDRAAADAAEGSAEDTDVSDPALSDDLVVAAPGETAAAQRAEALLLTRLRASAVVLEKHLASVVASAASPEALLSGSLLVDVLDSVLEHVQLALHRADAQGTYPEVVSAAAADAAVLSGPLGADSQREVQAVMFRSSAQFVQATTVLHEIVEACTAASAAEPRASAASLPLRDIILQVLQRHCAASRQPGHFALSLRLLDPPPAPPPSPHAELLAQVLSLRLRDARQGVPPAAPRPAPARGTGDARSAPRGRGPRGGRGRGRARPRPDCG
jgi:hypothetical protein